MLIQSIHYTFAPEDGTKPRRFYASFATLRAKKRA